MSTCSEGLHYCPNCDRSIDVAAMQWLQERLERYHDLVRYQRAELHEEGLLSDEEYAALVSDSKSVDRLHGYDELKQRADRLQAEVNDLRKLGAVLAHEIGERICGECKHEDCAVNRKLLQQHAAEKLLPHWGIDLSIELDLQTKRGSKLFGEVRAITQQLVDQRAELDYLKENICEDCEASIVELIPDPLGGSGKVPKNWWVCGQCSNKRYNKHQQQLSDQRAEMILAKTLLKVWLNKWDSAHFRDGHWKETDDFVSAG